MTRRRVVWLGVLLVLVLAALAACSGGAASTPQGGGLSEAAAQEAAAQQGSPAALPTYPQVTQPAGMYGLPTRPPAATEEATAEATEEATPEASEEPAPRSEMMSFKASGDGPEAIQDAYAEARTLEPEQPFEVTFTDAQLTAAVNARLAATGRDQLLHDLVITFVPDEIDVDAVLGLGQSGLSFAVALTMSAGVDENGNVQVEVLNAEAGGQQMPSEQLDILNEAVTAALVGASATDVPQGADLTFTDIVIEEGTATVSGYVTPQG